MSREMRGLKEFAKGRTPRQHDLNPRSDRKLDLTAGTKGQPLGLPIQKRAIPESDLAPDPRTPFEKTIRQLALAAMSVCHHDCGEQDIEWHHEVKALERRFFEILGAKS